MIYFLSFQIFCLNMPKIDLGLPVIMVQYFALYFVEHLMYENNFLGGMWVQVNMHLDSWGNKV